MVLEIALASISVAQPTPFPTFTDVFVPATAGPMGWNTITIDRSGNRYVTERWRYWIRKITPEGEVTTLAGDAVLSGSRDGKGPEARFSAPAGYLALAVDERGDIIVADTYNNSIRKVTADGEVTTLAGQAGDRTKVDGPAGLARFISPSAIAFGPGGTLYIADWGSIRTLSPDGIVATLAGDSGPPYENVDGVGSDARLLRVGGMAVDRDGNAYVACPDDTVRKISAAGVVTTLAGRAGQLGSADGTGADARFAFSAVVDFEEGIHIGMTVDAAGNVWLTDGGNRVVRRITPDGVVTSFGQSARLINPSGLVMDAAGSFHVVDQGLASRLLIANAESTFALHATPQSQTIAQGSTAVFSVGASGGTPLYRWTKDGELLVGATHSNLVISGSQSADAGVYGWHVIDSTGRELRGEATLDVVPSGSSGRLVNVSIRSDLVATSQPLTVGATIAGGGASETLPVLLRAAGPSLSRFSVGGFLEDPTITLLRQGSLVVANDDWGGDLQIATRSAAVGAFTLMSPASRDAAVVTALVPGSYIMEIAGKGSATGAVLGEWYDATPQGQRAPSSPRLINLSARKTLAANGETLTAGFTIDNPAAKTVLLRAMGPSLAALGVADVLENPMLLLFAGANLIRENQDWGGDDPVAAVSRAVEAFPFISAYSRDAALLITLEPGEYTMQVRSQGDGGGTVLAEIYEVP